MNKKAENHHDNQKAHRCNVTPSLVCALTEFHEDRQGNDLADHQYSQHIFRFIAPPQVVVHDIDHNGHDHVDGDEGKQVHTQDGYEGRCPEGQYEQTVEIQSGGLVPEFLAFSRVEEDRQERQRKEQSRGRAHDGVAQIDVGEHLDDFEGSDSADQGR